MSRYWKYLKNIADHLIASHKNTLNFYKSKSLMQWIVTISCFDIWSLSSFFFNIKSFKCLARPFMALFGFVVYYIHLVSLHSIVIILEVAIGFLFIRGSRVSVYFLNTKIVFYSCKNFSELVIFFVGTL